MPFCVPPLRIWKSNELSPAKAPGPDGMTASFYQQYWSFVGPAICDMVKSFFSSGFLLKQLNHTFVALIPKTTNLKVVEHFCPISLCNVSYKVISKLLADRLKVLVPKLISTNQSAFVLGRVIQENSVSAMELLHSLNRKFGKSGLMVIKLDMAQAYDRLEWKFLLHALKCFGFNCHWIHLIKECISTVTYSFLINVTYSLLINGSPHGMITPP